MRASDVGMSTIFGIFAFSLIFLLDKFGLDRSSENGVLIGWVGGGGHSLPLPHGFLAQKKPPRAPGRLKLINNDLTCNEEKFRRSVVACFFLS